MRDLDLYAKQAAETIVQEAQRRRTEKARPFLIAIDGGSGSGKSTVASAVAEKLGAVLVPGDDFSQPTYRMRRGHNETFKPGSLIVSIGND